MRSRRCPASAARPGRTADEGPADLRHEDGQELSGLLELLFEEPGLPVEQLPPPLAELYDGELGFARPLLYGNFVTSLDGVTAVAPTASGQGGLISGGLPADRFLMGLLRAFADVVLIGAGTLRAESDHVWSAGRVYPPAADAYLRLREFLLLPPTAPLAVVTGSGALDPALPALAGGLILTTGMPAVDGGSGRQTVSGRIALTQASASSPAASSAGTSKPSRCSARSRMIRCNSSGPTKACIASSGCMGWSRPAAIWPTM